MLMPNFLRRLTNMLFGLLLYGLGIVITIKANVGYAPWEVFHVGLADTIGLSIGVVSILAGAVFAVFVTLSGEKLGFGTLGSMALTGVFIDIFIALDFIPTAGNMAVGIAMLVAGLFIIAFGSYFYMKAGFGAGPRDNLMVVLARKTGFSVGVCRCAVELTATLIGWLFGGMVGVGTIISFIAIGVCVQLVFSILKFDVTAVTHESLTETLSRLSNRK